MNLKLVSCVGLLIFCLRGAASASAGINLIAYIDEAGDLYTIQPNGSDRRKLASGEVLSVRRPVRVNWVQSCILVRVQDL